jgi:hypothetical protein
MTQAAEFLVGLECNIGSLIPTKGAYNYTLGLIAAFGGSTPMVSETNPKLVLFNIPDAPDLREELIERYGCTENDLNNKTYVSFVPEDRENFYRQAYFGIRLKAYSKDGAISDLPALFDAAYGANDAASGGRGRLFTKKSVLRFDGFLPIKVFGVPVYIFGTAFINIHKSPPRKPLILGQPENGTASSNPDDQNSGTTYNPDELLILTECANKRDFFKVGIGIDLYKLFKSGHDKTDEAKKQVEEEKERNKELLEEAKKTLDEVQEKLNPKDADKKKSDKQN